MGLVEAIILSVIAASTPLLLAAAGELVVERSGVLNLGVEGMMIMGAACGFAGAYLSIAQNAGFQRGLAQQCNTDIRDIEIVQHGIEHQAQGTFLVQAVTVSIEAGIIGIQQLCQSGCVLTHPALQ